MSVLILIGKLILVVVVLLAAYICLGIIGNIIPINTDFIRSEKDIDVYLLRSESKVHIDICVPAVHQLFDWTSIFSKSSFANDINQNTFMAIGWGDRGFYLDIPTWSDLTPKIAINAMLLPSSSVLHVTAFDQLPFSTRKAERLSLSAYQYRLLCQYILDECQLHNGKAVQIRANGYSENDNFYAATSPYHAFNTCNLWVNRALRVIGVRTALFSPWVRGILYQLRKSKSEFEDPIFI